MQLRDLFLQALAANQSHCVVGTTVQRNAQAIYWHNTGMFEIASNLRFGHESFVGIVGCAVCDLTVP